MEIFGFVKGAYKSSGVRVPFGAAATAPEGGRPMMPGAENSNVVKWAGLVDDTHVLVQSAGSTLMLVELPGGKAVWKAEAGAGGRTGMMAGLRGSVETVPTLSPDRKLCAVCAGSGVRVVDPLTGAALNTLPTLRGGGVGAVGGVFSGWEPAGGGGAGGESGICGCV